MKVSTMVIEPAGGDGRQRAEATPMKPPAGKRTARIRLPITGPTVDALGSAQQSYIAWDERLTGFGVRVLPSGTKSYILNYRPGGGRRAPNRRIVLGRCERLGADEARCLAKETLARIAAGADPAAERAGARAARAMPTLGEALEELLAAVPERKAALYRRTAQRHLDTWLERRLHTITPEDVKTCFARITAEAGWMPANDTVRVLGALYRHCCADIRSLRDPVERWRSAGGRSHRQRYRCLPPPAVVLPCWRRGIEKGVRNPVARDALRFGLYTGLGRDAVLGLCWTQVDRAAMTLTVGQTGNGEPPVLPLPRQAGSILQRRLAERSSFAGHTLPWAFPSEASPSGRLHRLQHLNGRIGETGGARFWFDALHRTFIAVAEDELCLPDGLIQRLACRERAHEVAEKDTPDWSMEELREAVQRIADRIDALAET